MTAKPEKGFLILETEATPSAGVFRLVLIFDAQYLLNTFMWLFLFVTVYDPQLIFPSPRCCSSSSEPESSPESPAENSVAPSVLKCSDTTQSAPPSAP